MIDFISKTLSSIKFKCLKFFQNEEDLQTKLQAKKNCTPFVVAVGNLSQPTTIYTVLDSICHKQDSPLEAFDLAIKIYIALNTNYPSETKDAWLFFQRVIMRTVLGKDKISARLQDLLTYVRQNRPPSESLHEQQFVLSNRQG